MNKKHMTKKQIVGWIAALTNSTVAELAAQHNYSKEAFNAVLRGKSTSIKIQRIIASTIGKNVNDLWPETAKEDDK